MMYNVNMSESTVTPDLLRGHTDTIILKLLSTRDKYGYQIAKQVLQLSENQYQLHEATMYSSLKRLEREGFITSYWGDETQGARRKYYQITVGGWQQYQENIRNWNYAKSVLEKLL